MNTTLSKKNLGIVTALLAVVLLLLAAGVGWYSYANNYHIELPSLAQLTTKPANQSPLAYTGIPVHISIPKIGVNANIIKVGLTKDGAVDTPKGPYEVGWYKLGTRPGDTGSAVLTGHYGQWVSGAHSVFDSLNQLKKGDTFSITDDKGAVTQFKVTDIRQYDPTAKAPEIFNKNDGKYLNIITCQGDWIASQDTFSKRLVVFSEKVE